VLPPLESERQRRDEFVGCSIMLAGSFVLFALAIVAAMVRVCR
jgi:hypothetical protein